jgi:hypothetical protein
MCNDVLSPMGRRDVFRKGANGTFVLFCLMAEQWGYGLPTCQQAAQQPNGEPPAAAEELTSEMVSQYCKVIEWVLDVRLTESQKQKAKQFLKGYFERNDRERKCRRELPYTMRKMRQEATAGGAEAQWRQQVYFASHPIFLPGEPPLTREVADAWIAMDYFVRSRYYDSMKETAGKYPSVTFPRLWKVTPPDRSDARPRRTARPGEVEDPAHGRTLQVFCAAGGARGTDGALRRHERQEPCGTLAEGGSRLESAAISD